MPNMVEPTAVSPLQSDFKQPETARKVDELRKDVKEALRYFFEKEESSFLSSSLWGIFGESDDALQILISWSESCRFPKSFLDRVPSLHIQQVEKLEAEFKKFPLIKERYQDEFWEKARQRGFQPKGIKKAKKRPEKTKQIEANPAIVAQEITYLQAGFVCREGCTYYHTAMKTKEFPEPGEELDDRFRLVMENEIEVLETVEYVHDTGGRLASEIRIKYKAILNDGIHSTHTELASEHLAKLDAFSKLLIEKGYRTFKGDKILFDKFVDWIISSKVPRVRVMTHWGRLEDGVFLYENGIFDATKNAFFPADDQKRISFRNKSLVCPKGSENTKPPIYHLPTPEVVTKLKETLHLWETVNGRFNVRTIISYAIASLFSSEIIEAQKWSRGFPMLFNYGEAGTGKSSTTDLFMRLFGYKTGNRQAVSSQSTFKGLNRKLTLSHTFPFFLDDYRDHTRPDMKNVPDMIQNMLNYYHHMGAVIAMKTTDNSTLDFPMNATVAWTGNDLPPDPAARMRCLVLYFTKKLSKREQEELSRLELNADRLSIFIPLILTRYMEVKAYFMKSVESHFPYINGQKLESRISHHWAYIFAAYDTYMNFFEPEWKQGREAYIQEAIQILIADQNRTEQNIPLNRFWEALDFMAGVSDGYEGGKTIFAIDERYVRLVRNTSIEVEKDNVRSFDQVLAIHLPDLWNKLATKNHPLAKELALGDLDYLIQRSPYFVKKSHPTRFKRGMGQPGEISKRAIILDSEAMEKMHLMPTLFAALEQRLNEEPPSPPATLAS